MQARILALLIVFADVLVVQTELLVMYDRISISAGQTQELRMFCNNNSIYANDFLVYSADGEVIGKDDTFEVRTKAACSSNTYLNPLSSQGSVNKFTWSGGSPGYFLPNRGLCVEIECTNYFLSCSIGYRFLADCL